MTTAKFKIQDNDIIVTARYFHGIGDGYNSEHIAAHWEINEILLNEEDVDTEYISIFFNMEESEVEKIIEQQLWKQDYLDWEMCQTFI